MGKLNAYQKRQILIRFSIQTLSHNLINNLNCRSLANKNAFSIKILDVDVNFPRFQLFIIESSSGRSSIATLENSSTA
jgi:hypothetical protein